MLAKCLHAGGVAQVEPENFQPMAPFGEVRLLRVTRGGGAREPRRDDEVSARTEHSNPRLIPNFDAPAGEQGHAPFEVGTFGALAKIQISALRAQLVVEMMDGRV